MLTDRPTLNDVIEILLYSMQKVQILTKDVAVKVGIVLKLHNTQCVAFTHPMINSNLNNYRSRIQIISYNHKQYLAFHSAD